MSEPAVPAPEPAPEPEWQRLDPRMLLVHPIREVGRFLPVLIGVFVAGSASGSSWQFLGVLLPVAVGLLRYLTTSFRIGRGRVELRRGLLSRHVLSIPVDRVRTVDLTSTLVHRVLGLTTLRIGTGTASTKDEDTIDLDGLPVERARLLREELLRVAPHPGAAPAPDGTPAPDAARPVLRLDPRWARFAPLTSTGLVIGAAVVGVGFQVLEGLGVLGSVDLSVSPDDTSAALTWLVVAAVLLGGLLVVSLLAVAGYLVANWAFTLVHTGRTWHLSRGLLTTRETTLDDERVAGAGLIEPLGLRLLGAGRLSAIVTGLDRGEQGSSVLVPPAPYDVVVGVAGQVLADDAPVRGPLVPHGPLAVRRRLVRAVAPAALVGLVLLLLVLVLDWTPWLLVAAVLAPVAGVALGVDRGRALGHALTRDHLVARSGSLVRRREVLGTDHVIGWTFRDTWFQRRAGLTSLVATTAGGRQSVTVLDLPEAVAVALADAAVPGLVAPFLTGAPTASRTRSGGTAASG